MPDDVDDGRLLQSWIAMAKEARELWIPRRVPTVDTRDLTPLAFQRKFVGPNTPVLIRGGCRHWPAFDRWTNSYLLERMGSSQLTVALTPDGHGDCPVGGRFVLPHEERMDLAAFFETLRDPSGNAVPYIQKQCNSLDEEFGQLRDDIAELEIGKTVFEHLDATNLWIGDERAVSATHSDPYENLYCVVAGTKHVTLYPPTDLPFLYRKTFSVGQYVREPSGMAARAWRLLLTID
ncbi:hypothetical protein PBRA_008836 [Plasmodiophora brassicae]|uniref:JmjC domain-containing protein n=1 Tax=Plasmodiophora brassicae TaxID=37360 RepID=A0A0G4J2M9_PLABS|nr:hypothetical protein PBRA_008836 [Plasmodiophora brassicae]